MLCQRLRRRLSIEASLGQDLLIAPAWCSSTRRLLSVRQSGSVSVTWTEPGRTIITVNDSRADRMGG